MLVRKLQHALRERRGKEHIQPLIGRREAPQDVPDVADESEIEHAIGFIQHEHLHEAQIDHVLLHEIDDPSGGADQDVDALFEMVLLFFVIDPTKGESQLQSRMRAERLGIAMDLHCQFARWGDDQCAWRIQTPRCRYRLANQPRIKRDQKRRRLTRSGLCLTCNVDARQGLRQCLSLDRRAAFERGIRKSFLQCFGQMQTREGQFSEV